MSSPASFSAASSMRIYRPFIHSAAGGRASMPRRPPHSYMADKKIQGSQKAGLAASQSGGIGFTMSILISGLAFPTAQFEVLAAKAAILAGSVTAAVLGMIYMSVVCKHPAPKNE